MHAGTKGSLPTTYFAPPPPRPNTLTPLSLFSFTHHPPYTVVVAPPFVLKKNELKAPAAGGGGIWRKVSPAHTTFFFPLPPSLPYAVGPLFN